MPPGFGRCSRKVPSLRPSLAQTRYVTSALAILTFLHPHLFKKHLRLLRLTDLRGVHSYMPNAGLLDVRSRIATQVNRDQQVELGAEEIIMTCGAAGGLNIIFKSLLNLNEEIIVPTPYFVEYGFYVDNHGGKLVPVESKSDFSLDIETIENAINNKTKAVLLNSPNNPSGAIYSKKELEALAKLLTRASDYFSHPIFLISDEPYRRLVFHRLHCASDPQILPEQYSNHLFFQGPLHSWRTNRLCCSPSGGIPKDRFIGSTYPGKPYSGLC